MNKKFRFIIFAGVVFISLTLVFCAGYFRKNITLESGRFNLNLGSGYGISKSEVAVCDIQNKDLSKKLVQPDIMSISTGSGSEVTNSSDKPIWLSIKVTGIKGIAKILSTDPNFDEKTECCLKPLMPGDKLDLKVNLNLSNKALTNYLVCKGTIEFLDYKCNKKLGVVPLKFINSKPQNSCCTIDDECN